MIQVKRPAAFHPAVAANGSVAADNGVTQFAGNALPVVRYILGVHMPPNQAAQK
jgi:hypothetical protein